MKTFSMSKTIKTFSVRRRSSRIDRDRLLDRLAAPEHRPSAEDEELFARSSLPRTALTMAEVDQESEYRLCRETAERLVGAVPDPDEIPL